MPAVRRALPYRILCSAIVVTLCADAAAFQAPDGKPSPGGGVRTFAPGVRIDWTTRTVELDARVVLRRGPLELFACTPGTREHESIVTVRTGPAHIYQALGLIGLEPGSPVRFDRKRERYLPPTGEALEILVRYEKDGLQRTAPIERWMTDVARRRQPESIPWVFAGSRVLDDGRLGARTDGTIVCVVDFGTALVAIGSLHTSDNEALWLAANTEEIPPVRTECTLLIRARVPERIEAELARDGTLHLAGAVLSSDDLARRLKADRADRTSVGLVLRVRLDVSAPAIEAAIDSLVRTGVNRAIIEVWLADPPTPPKATKATSSG